MKKILLVDYYGICDDSGKAIGHSAKVLSEYTKLLQTDFEVSVAVSPCLIPKDTSSFKNVVSLKFNIYADDATSIVGRIKDKFKLIFNIYKALSLKEYDIIWFYRSDFFLFLFLACKLTKSNSKLVAQIYHEDFAKGKLGKILKLIYKKGSLRFDGLIYTQEGMAKHHSNVLYIPDYYDDEEKYARYKENKKEEKVVCVGTMNPYKKIEELVDVFKRLPMRLEIKGFFYEKERFEKLCQQKTENIVIKDVILSEEEYYQTLSSAKYAILPYDMEQYRSRTSGVLLECLFLNTIAIAPKELLLENGVNGLGYKDLSDLENTSFWSEETLSKNEDIKNKYMMSEIRKKLIGFLK